MFRNVDIPEIPDFYKYKMFKLDFFWLGLWQMMCDIQSFKICILLNLKNNKFWWKCETRPSIWENVLIYLSNYKHEAHLVSSFVFRRNISTLNIYSVPLDRIQYSEAKINILKVFFDQWFLDISPPSPLP